MCSVPAVQAQCQAARNQSEASGAGPGPPHPGETFPALLDVPLGSVYSFFFFFGGTGFITR